MKIRKHLAAAAMLLMAAVTVAQNPSAPGCGEAKAKFAVSTQKGAQLPSAPAAGKALLVFFETGCKGCDLPPIRFGAKGAWLGATKPDSWFAVEVDPGMLNVCSDWQGGFGRQQQDPRTVVFVADAGKTYYFEARTQITNNFVGAGIDAHSELDGNFDLIHDSSDEALALLQKQQHAVFKRKK